MTGWVLFALSGVLFLILGIRDGDALAIGAAALWTVGCVVFISDR
ncbi:MAG: hypothetical protein ACR2QK_22365 [Acidimicrobiales bacterium]